MLNFLKPPVSQSRRRAWVPISVSGALHLLLLALAMGLSRQTDAPSRSERRDGPVPEPPQIQMIHIPAPEMMPPALPIPPRPPPPVRRAEPEPEPNAPPEATRSTGAETPITESGGGEPLDEPADAEPAPEEQKVEATLESEARRIFGRPRLATRPGAGPQAIRPMEAWAPDRPERCVPRPVVARDSDEPVQLGTVEGRIYRQDTGQPLAGAHLQMIGTPYVTFTDGRGEYRFRFDLALVDNCRTQYVRVSAEGYESRLLVLLVGPRRSEDVRLRRM